MKSVHAGLTILLKYDPSGSMCAEHDEIYAGNTPPEKMSEEDRKTLEENHWRWDEYHGSWAKFT